jgi:hypothetical protein
MGLGWTLILIAAVVIVIWVAVEFKRFKHKFFAVLLIILIIFGYLSFIIVFKGKDVDLKSADGVQAAGKIYFAWLGSVFSNFKTITANAVHMDWKADENVTTVTKAKTTSSNSKTTAKEVSNKK